MTATYPETMAGWSDWQRSFQFGTLLVLPPPHVGQEIDALRTRYDQVSQAAIGPHISLTVALQRAPTDRDWIRLREIASGFAPLAIRYGPLVPFLPKPGGALHIEPQAELDSLRRALEACDLFRNAGPRAYPFWAHMTIAEFITDEASKDMVGDLGGDRAPAGGFVCDHLSYVVPDESFCFRERGKLVLGNAR